MKIIFDSEEQKEKFEKLILGPLEGDYCPSYLYLNEPGCSHITNVRDCVKCWEKCGIEMEVRDENECGL